VAGGTGGGQRAIPDERPTEIDLLRMTVGTGHAHVGTFELERGVTVVDELGGLPVVLGVAPRALVLDSLSQKLALVGIVVTAHAGEREVAQHHRIATAREDDAWVALAATHLSVATGEGKVGAAVVEPGRVPTAEVVASGAAVSTHIAIQGTPMGIGMALLAAGGREVVLENGPLAVDGSALALRGEQSPEPCAFHGPVASDAGNRQVRSLEGVGALLMVGEAVPGGREAL